MLTLEFHALAGDVKGDSATNELDLAGVLGHNAFVRATEFVEQLAPGRHALWGRNITLEAQDTRKRFLAVAGQEVLTADNIAVKISLLVTYQVAEPVVAAHETQNWLTPHECWKATRRL